MKNILVKHKNIIEEIILRNPIISSKLLEKIHFYLRRSSKNDIKSNMLSQLISLIEKKNLQNHKVNHPKLILRTTC